MAGKLMNDVEAERKKDKGIRKEHQGNEEGRSAACIKNSIGMEFMLIPAGEFRMDPYKHSYGILADKVITSKPFYLGKYLVTQKDWITVKGSDPSCFEGCDRPVECVSWNDVQDFVVMLNEMESTDKYRLPTEAEWEYACRAGTSTRYSFGDADSKLGEYAWYYRNSEQRTHPVGLKKPNPWGLYDMHGNVWEWCQNRHHEDYEDTMAGLGVWEAAAGSDLVLRGGSWVNYPMKCRSSYRIAFHPNYGHYSIGFRLLLSV